MKIIKKTILLFTVHFIPLVLQAQNITLEDIWSNGTFKSRFPIQFEWLSDSTYTLCNGNEIISYTANGIVKDTLLQLNKINQNIVQSIDEYTITDKYILLKSNTEAIYRRSTKSNSFIYNRITKNIFQVANSKISHISFNSSQTKLAYINENNLFIVDIERKITKSVTKDGVINKIINGMCDWVYEEEFEFTKAYQWSEDGNKIVFYSFNEENVPVYAMQVWSTSNYPHNVEYKYPKAGEQNSKIKILVYDVQKNKSKIIYDSGVEDIYIPKIQWVDNDNISILKMNRLQNELSILHYKIKNDKFDTVYKEKSSTYIEVPYYSYLKNKPVFIITSEEKGYKQLHSFDYHKSILQPISKNSIEVDEVLFVNQITNEIDFTTVDSSTFRRVWKKTNLEGFEKIIYSNQSYINLDISPSGLIVKCTESTINTPPVYSLMNNNGKLIRILEENNDLKLKINKSNFSTIKFETIKTKDATLRSWTMKPVSFDSSRKYPCLMYVYGGPGHQLVLDSWHGANYLWFQYLVSQGWIVTAIDNRGTGGMGEMYKKCTYNKLGTIESNDQIDAVKILRNRTYIDSSRIGIWGWSFGGYLAGLTAMKSGNLFKFAISVAPVTDWRFYDSIYTERFMKLPSENNEGYLKSSLITWASELKSNYLLIHGTADDNVHVQHSFRLQSALIQANKKFSSFYYPDKNHGISGGKTRLHLFKQMSDFIISQ